MCRLRRSRIDGRRLAAEGQCAHVDYETDVHPVVRHAPRSQQRRRGPPRRYHARLSTTKWIVFFIFFSFFSDIVPPPQETTSSVEDIDLAALPPPPDFLLETAEDDTTTTAATQKEAVTIPERSLSVADAVKTLNEIRHQPASPGVVRRAQSMRATTDSSSPLLTAAAGGRHPPSVLAKTLLGTTPKSRQQMDAAHHHTFTLTKNSSKTGPANHTKTLPKHMPSHPVSPFFLFILETINNNLLVGLSGFRWAEETGFGFAIKVEFRPPAERQIGSTARAPGRAGLAATGPSRTGRSPRIADGSNTTRDFTPPGQIHIRSVFSSFQTLNVTPHLLFFFFLVVVVVRMCTVRDLQSATSAPPPIYILP